MQNTKKIAQNYLTYKASINCYEEHKRYVKAVDEALDLTISESVYPSRAKKVRKALVDRIINGLKCDDIHDIDSRTLNKYVTLFYDNLERILNN